ELLRVPLNKARELAAAQATVRRGAKAWADLSAAALREAGLPTDVRASALDEEAVKKLVAAVARNHRDRFKSELPDTAAELDRLRGEARGVTLSAAERSRIALVLGAVEGEYLRRKHAARWVLKPKPAGAPLAAPEIDDLFRHLVDPFRDLWGND